MIRNSGCSWRAIPRIFCEQSVYGFCSSRWRTKPSAAAFRSQCPAWRVGIPTARLRSRRRPCFSRGAAGPVGFTRLTILTLYQSAEHRAGIIGSGMEPTLADSYARLDAYLTTLA